MLELFHQPGACSLASHILLEESGLEYKPHFVDLRAKKNLSPDFLKINPKGRIPALRTSDGQILTESPAILAYIAKQVPDKEFWPQDVLDQARVLEWMNWLSGSLHAVAFAALIHPDWFSSSADAHSSIQAKASESVKRHFEQIDEKLAASEWAVGSNFTLVDPYLFVFYTWGEIFEFEMARYCAYRGHALRMQERTAVAAIMADEGVARIS